MGIEISNATESFKKDIEAQNLSEDNEKHKEGINIFRSRRALNYEGAYIPDDFGLLQNFVLEVDISFDKAIFKGQSNFSYTKYKGKSSFHKTTFKDSTCFSESSFRGYTSFENATFSRDVSFKHVTFSWEVYFSEAKFGGNTYFYNAIFSRKASFSRATFNSMVFFDSVTFNGIASFINTTFDRETNFTNTTFSEEAYFNTAVFMDASFSSTTFSKEMEFERVILSGKADFSRSTFNGKASFSQTMFSEGAGFSHTIFNEKANYTSVRFSGKADFQEATFNEEANFAWVDFSGETNFYEAAFSSMVNFHKATFSGKAIFVKATFSGEVDFNEATFSGEASFSEATFSGESYLRGAAFSGKVDFNEATFIGPVNFEGAIFDCEANFIKATFSASSLFNKVIFNSDVSFAGSIFNGRASFGLATFKAIAFFYMTTFNGEAIFAGLTFSSETSFELAIFSSDIEFVDIFYIADISFDGCNIKKGKLKFRNTYIFSKGSFRDISDGAKITFINSYFHKISFLRSRIENTVFSNCHFSLTKELTTKEIEKINYELKSNRILEHITERPNQKLLVFKNKNQKLSELNRREKRLQKNNLLLEHRDFLNQPHFRLLIRKLSRRGLKIVISPIFRLFPRKLIALRKKLDSSEESIFMDFGEVRDNYMQLKVNMDRMKDYDLSNDFYYGEMEMKRLGERWYKPKRWFLSLYKTLSGYGNAPVRAVIMFFALIWIFSFPLFFMKLGIKDLSSQNKNQVSRNYVRLETSFFRNFGEMASLSLYNMTALSNLTRSPYEPLIKWTFYYVSIVQYFLRPVQIALIILAIRRKVKRGEE